MKKQHSISTKTHYNKNNKWNLTKVALVIITTLMLTGCENTADVAFWQDCSYKPSLTAEEESKASREIELQEIGNKIDEVIQEME